MEQLWNFFHQSKEVEKNLLNHSRKNLEESRVPDDILERWRMAKKRFQLIIGSTFGHMQLIQFQSMYRISFLFRKPDACSNFVLSSRDATCWVELNTAIIPHDRWAPKVFWGHTSWNEEERIQRIEAALAAFVFSPTCHVHFFQTELRYLGLICIADDLTTRSKLLLNTMETSWRDVTILKSYFCAPSFVGWPRLSCLRLLLLGGFTLNIHEREKCHKLQRDAI